MTASSGSRRDRLQDDGVSVNSMSASTTVAPSPMKSASGWVSHQHEESDPAAGAEVHDGAGTCRYLIRKYSVILFGGQRRLKLERAIEFVLAILTRSRLRHPMSLAAGGAAHEINLPRPPRKAWRTCATAPAKVAVVRRHQPGQGARAFLPKSARRRSASAAANLIGHHWHDRHGRGKGDDGRDDVRTSCASANAPSGGRMADDDAPSFG